MLSVARIDEKRHRANHAQPICCPRCPCSSLLCVFLRVVLCSVILSLLALRLPVCVNIELATGRLVEQGREGPTFAGILLFIFPLLQLLEFGLPLPQNERGILLRTEGC
jgi:hypothetical protein